MSSVASIIKTAPENIVMEVPDGIITSKVKVVFTMILQGSSPLTEIGGPV